MRHVINIGDVFGKLTVIAKAERSAKGLVQWRCLCACGAVRTAIASGLYTGDTKSCGSKECRKDFYRNSVNGLSSGPEYQAWCGAKERCINPKHPAYRYYGGKGITMCQEWIDSFLKFYEDMGPRPDGMSLERKDNFKGYSPDNCKWATHQEQMLNRGTCSETILFTSYNL